MRLIMALAVAHCAGGPDSDQFDALGALDAWVQSGKAPEVLLATKDKAADVTAAVRVSKDRVLQREWRCQGCGKLRVQVRRNASAIAAGA
jgi:hypothetical protein